MIPFSSRGDYLLLVPQGGRALKRNMALIPCSGISNCSKMNRGWSQCTRTLPVLSLKQDRVAYWYMGAYWNEDALSKGVLIRIGALISIIKFKGGAHNLGALIWTRTLNGIITVHSLQLRSWKEVNDYYFEHLSVIPVEFYSNNIFWFCSCNILDNLFWLCQSEAYNLGYMLLINSWRENVVIANLEYWMLWLISTWQFFCCFTLRLWFLYSNTWTMISWFWIQALSNLCFTGKMFTSR